MDIREIKEKFNTVQSIGQSLKEEKIGLESELRTLTADYDEQVKQVLEKTGTTSLADAVKVFQERRTSLDAEMESLSQELSGYLDTYGEGDVNGVQ